MKVSLAHCIHLLFQWVSNAPHVSGNEESKQQKKKTQKNTDLVDFYINSVSISSQVLWAYAFPWRRLV